MGIDRVSLEALSFDKWLFALLNLVRYVRPCCDEGEKKNLKAPVRPPEAGAIYLRMVPKSVESVEVR